MLGIGEMYRANHRITPYGIQGYKIEKRCQFPNKEIKDKHDKLSKEELKKRETKRGHYLEDYAKVHDYIPGPGVYNYPTGNWTLSNNPSKTKIKPKKKLTYIDEIVEREKKEKTPAPGQYKLFKDQKDIKAEKKRLANKKINHSERITYLDAVQYDANTTPGVGSYNPTLYRPRSATFLHRNKSPIITRPVSSLKKKLKQPDAGSYHPQNILQHKSFSRKTKGYHEWGRSQRFRSDKSGSNLGPGVYVKANDDKMVCRHSAKNVYYN